MPVNHGKTNNIIDWTQEDLDAQIALGNFPPGTLLADIILPSDWNDAHTVSIDINEINATGTPSAANFLRGDGVWSSPAGGGTVTSVSVVTANGVSGSVATATSTPAITLTLGAITPSSVSSTGTVTGTNLSGTNTGDQDLSGLVPYTGATADVDLGANHLNAEGMSINGTSGNGHLHFKHQSSDASSTGSSTVLFADSNGDLKSKNDGGFYSTMKTSLITADRVYTFPNNTGTLVLTSDLSTYAPLNSPTFTGTVAGITASMVGALATTAFVGTAIITVGTTAPASPSVGDLWVDTN